MDNQLNQPLNPYDPYYRQNETNQGYPDLPPYSSQYPQFSNQLQPQPQPHIGYYLPLNPQFSTVNVLGNQLGAQMTEKAAKWRQIKHFEACMWNGWRLGFAFWLIVIIILLSYWSFRLIQERLTPFTSIICLYFLCGIIQSIIMLLAMGMKSVALGKISLFLMGILSVAILGLAIFFGYQLETYVKPPDDDSNLGKAVLIIFLAWSILAFLLNTLIDINLGRKILKILKERRNLLKEVEQME